MVDGVVPPGVVVDGVDGAMLKSVSMPSFTVFAITGLLPWVNTTTKLTDKGNGLHEGIGSLGSGGTWQVNISVQKSGQVIATKQLHVNATGGM